MRLTAAAAALAAASVAHAKKVCYKKPGKAVTNAWCNSNCNHKPPYCPAAFCRCEKVTPAPTPPPATPLPTPVPPKTYKKRTCSCVGDPHCTSFDKKRFDWYGECDYTLVKDARAAPDGTPFEVQIRNSDPQPVNRPNVQGGYVTMITDVTVTLPNGDQLYLNRDPTCLRGPEGRKKGSLAMFPEFVPNNMLNGAPLSIPHTGPGYEVKYYKNTMPGSFVWKPAGKAVGVEIPSLGVKIVWTECHRIQVIIAADSPLHEHTAGMCGNSNGDKGDDAVVPEQLLPSKFPTQQCTEVKPPPPELPNPLCDDPAALELCGKINDETACHAAVDPNPFFEYCMVDACAMPDLLDVAAANVESYEFECCDAGVIVGDGCAPWDEQDDTSLSGDPFTEYNSKRTQFYLAAGKHTPLIACGATELSGAPMGTGIPGDHQQWFRSFAVRAAGAEALRIEARDVEGPVDSGDADRRDDVTVSFDSRVREALAAARQRGAAEPLTTLSVNASGLPVTRTGAGSATEGGIGYVVARDPSRRFGAGFAETVTVTAPEFVAQFSSAVASKPGAAARMHIDMRFTRLNAAACTGVLPEIWGTAPMTNGTARMLYPQQ